MDENENNELKEGSKKSSNMTAKVVTVAALLLLLGGFWVAQNRQTTENDITQTMPAGENGNGVMEDDSLVGGDAVVEDGDAMGPEGGSELDAAMENSVNLVEVEGGSFYYEPDTITVKKGEKVKIVLNSADAMHDFVIDELGVRTEIVQAGSIGEVEFTVEGEAGEYEFYCSVGNHKAMGMVGTLIIEE